MSDRRRSEVIETWAVSIITRSQTLAILRSLISFRSCFLDAFLQTTKHESIPQC